MTTRVTPREAHALTTNEGWSYVDVRTVAEFEAGHPAGAYNVPLLVDGPGGRVPNPAFLDAMQRTFPSPSAKLVVGCLAATRSTRAAELLAGAGYASLAIQIGGWAGATDPFGRVTTPGWKAAGLPTSLEAEPGHAWREIAGT